MEKKEKIVLAYSGGLDTSVAIKWLMDKGYDVVCYMADVGQGKDVENARKRALSIGASKCIVADLRERFIKEYVFPTLKAGAKYQGKYNMATSLSRPIIAADMIEIAKKEKAVAIAHGCTGKGNDQVRFEVTFHIKAPNLKVIAPVREWELKTREDEIEYAKKHNIPIEQTKKKIFSIDHNLWGTSVEGGSLEDPCNEPAVETYITIVKPESAPNKAEYVTVTFKKGIPIAINGKTYEPLVLIDKLNKMGAKHGIGRVDMIEDRLVGIKSREIYEAPASEILYSAHTSLEELVLDRETRRYKDDLSRRYAELVYYGLWFTPLREAFDAFIDKTSERVNGDVKLKLYKGQVIVAGRKSPDSRYQLKLATYGEGDVFDQSLAKGFISLWAMPYKE
ncbi:argininosuccinate synthase [Candidatus Omnitrophus magneticus]|uniref:Argininosuccinate synthase n=1 Tax=Candidatus Omnitrophus magneticus TaxID=1609969 RepID=A0A0F0CNZ7_9BACT|nr:argininosuccinate synthase [Candidatus Omnitrophus magneticus]